MTPQIPSAGADPLRYYLLVLAAAAIVAAVSARPYAGCWNDGSRLAAVESIVDRHTLVIDDSLFVQPAHTGQSSPYSPDNPFVKNGTSDKLLVNGRFYSDKPPVQALMLAGAYQGWQWLGGPTARQRPDLFCYLMTLLGSGLAYVVAVGCLYRLGHLLGLGIGIRLVLTASFALGTVALAYTQYLNGHVSQLGAVMALMLALAGLAPLDCRLQIADCRMKKAPPSGFLSSALQSAICNLQSAITWRLFLVGGLGGLAYALDLGVGPVLLFCLGLLIVYRCQRFAPVAVFCLGALPWLLLHHTVNYAVGGTFAPANAVVEYNLWPGSPFSPRDCTGAWNHTPGHFVLYAAGMLLGKRGFLVHNLPLLLAVPLAVWLLRRKDRFAPEMAFGLAWCAGAWLVYSAFSTNWSGACCSVRWFLPFLGPLYFALARGLAVQPALRRDFLVLAGWGIVLGGVMWVQGPWTFRLIPFLWPIVAAALLNWLGVRWWTRRQRVSPAPALSRAA